MISAAAGQRRKTHPRRALVPLVTAASVCLSAACLWAAAGPRPTHSVISPTQASWRWAAPLGERHPRTIRPGPGARQQLVTPKRLTERPAPRPAGVRQSLLGRRQN